MIRTAFCGIFVFGAASQGVAATTTENLLTNPGAESGSISGWTRGGTSSPFVDNGTWETDATITPHTGNYDFAGGTGATGSLNQTVSLAGISGISYEAIDLGNVTANIGFWEESLSQTPTSDGAYITISFLNASSSTISSYSTSLITSTDGWMEVTGTTAVPQGTRKITFSINYVRSAGNDVDAFVDDTTLKLTAVPEPAAWAMLLMGAGALGIYRRRGCFLR